MIATHKTCSFAEEVIKPVPAQPSNPLPVARGNIPLTAEEPKSYPELTAKVRLLYVMNLYVLNNTVFILAYPTSCMGLHRFPSI